MSNKLNYNAIFSFGKYKDTSLEFVFKKDPQYIAWVSTNSTIPGDWAEACRRIINNESIEDLSLPRSEYKDNNFDVEMWMAPKGKAIHVSFSYDKELLERFKFEIDGRKWNATEKCWSFPIPQIVRVVEFFGGVKHIAADDKVRQAYREEKNRRADLDDLRDNYETELELPGFKVDLYKFQNSFLKFAERANGRVLLADGMGTGKTIQSIAYAHYTKSKTVIFCPKSVVIQWAREIERATGKKATIWTTKTKEGRVDAQYHIGHYEVAEVRKKELQALNANLLICDEATALKNRKTKRAMAILGDPKRPRAGMGIKTDKVIFLTGTPILNRPLEAFTLLHFLDNKRFSSMFHFTQQYGGWLGDPPRNLDDLHYRTKDLVIRRLKKDVLKDLPAKQRNDLFIELSPSERKEYDKLLRELFQNWGMAGRPTVGSLPALQRFLNEKKMHRLKEMVDELLEQDRGVLIFSCYIDPLYQMEKLFPGQTAIIHGQLKTTERQESIDLLSTGKKKVGLFSLGAGAVGIDGLQHQMDTVIAIDKFWYPSIHEQAEDRLYRMGQTKQVSSFYLTIVDTIDEYMGQLLRDKQEMIDLAIDGKIVNPAAFNSVFGEFVRKLKKEYSTELKKLDISKADEEEIPDLE